MPKPKRKNGDWDNDAADAKDELEESKPVKEKNSDDEDELLLDDLDELVTDEEDEEEDGI